MPYWRLFYHMIWSTRGREPLIQTEWSPRLYAAVTAKAQSLRAIVHAVGGTEDHLHVALSIPPSVRLSEIVGQMKGNSTHLVNSELEPGSGFAWQASYGVVSFGEKDLPRIVRPFSAIRSITGAAACPTSLRGWGRPVMLQTELEFLLKRISLFGKGERHEHEEATAFHP